MHRDVETHGVLDACHKLGIGFVPYSPINRSFLGGDINEYPFRPDERKLPDPTPLPARGHEDQHSHCERSPTVRKHARHDLGASGSRLAIAFHLTAEEWRKLETSLTAIPVVGDRYNAEQRLVDAKRSSAPPTTKEKAAESNASDRRRFFVPRLLPGVDGVN